MQVGRLRITPVHARQLIANTSMAYTTDSIRNVSKDAKPWGQERRRRVSEHSQDEPSQDDFNPKIPHIIPPSAFFLKKYVNTKQEHLSRAPEPPPTAPSSTNNLTHRPETRSTWDLDRFEALHQHPKEFYEILDSILRRSAEDMGLKVFPDGFFRVSDILECHRIFRPFNSSTFIKMCKNDPSKRFELARLPEFVDGRSQEVLWVRSTGHNMMRGIDITTHRVISMSRLKTLVYLCRVSQSNKIEKNGIKPGPGRYIRLFRSVASSNFNDSQVPSQNLACLCVTVDAERAAQLGVTFFVNTRNFILAVANSDGVIPREALLSGSLLRIKSLPLLSKR